MGAGDDPGFVGDARGIGAERNIRAADFDDALVLADFLIEDVAENAALFGSEVVAPRAEFVEHAPGNERSRGELKVGMLEFLRRPGALILEQADVFKAGITFQILHALRGQR